jgi:apolipoprotein N-acyltransferase
LTEIGIESASEWEDARPRVRRAALACLVGGVVTALSVPPFGWWPLGPVGLAVLAWQLGDRSWKQRIALAAAYGLGLYGVGLAWAFEFTGGAVAFIALVAIQTAVVYALVPPNADGAGRWLGFVAATVGAELVRSVWPFGGLPLSGIDLGQAGGPLAPIVAVGGRLLLVGTVAALAAALAALATRRRTAVVTAGALAVAALAVTTAGWVVPRGHDTGTAIRVAVVQGGGPRGIRAESADEAAVFRRQVETTRAIEGHVDLVLWPEDVVDVPTLAGSPEERTLQQLAKDLDTTVVAGGVEDAPNGRFHNAAVAYGPTGTVVDRYEKVHRVPFGEYFPFRSFLENVASIPDRDALPGPHRPGVLGTPAAKAGVVISYEVFFQGRARSAIADGGGQILLVPTNASSYTTTQMPAQEVAAARLRAWQTGRNTVQAAPTGFSAFVDHRGRVTQQTDLGAPQWRVATVRLRTGTTPFDRTGDVPTVTGAAVLLGAAWLLERRRLKFPS